MATCVVGVCTSTMGEAHVGTEQEWNHIFGKDGVHREPAKLPAVTKLVTPRVHNPVCPDHCGPRHEVDGLVVCTHCQVPKYRVVLHEWFHTEGHYWNSLEPMNGAPPHVGSDTPVCTCGREMERRWI